MGNENAAAVIYVVDADAGVREGIGRVVRSAGFGARAYGSVEQLLVAMETRGRGCILLDIALPVESCLRLRARLDADVVPLPLVALSARDDAATRERAREVGSSFLLSKPVDDQALLDAIHWVMDVAASGTTTG